MQLPAWHVGLSSPAGLIIAQARELGAWRVLRLGALGPHGGENGQGRTWICTLDVRVSGSLRGAAAVNPRGCENPGSEAQAGALGLDTSGSAVLQWVMQDDAPLCGLCVHRGWGWAEGSWGFVLSRLASGTDAGPELGT